MKTIAHFLNILFALAIAGPLLAADPRNISWQDLLPEERPYHDPFATLEYSQVNALAMLYRIEVLHADTADDKKRAEAVQIREDLVSQGLDPDWLFEQREIVMNQRLIAAREPNLDLLGENVRLPGYLLPLDIVDQKAVEFLLVPTVGACIHTPPPPANQMVYVRYEQGFEIDELYKPVWISGEMQALSRSQSLNYVDGQANIETSYAMDALSVEIYD
ncbi:DUF3299 domain-containing protein [Ruegeria sp. AD91A]|uniref:DUF3299 domain-containing protein n=1 Tax=Ruegeria sp. AD91A TaxID=2293862 RepID=UPI000E46E8C1|nr:DUF3299 domain-containing protein [Ruegeria sp. AD91A]AXT27413.1 DUF3299 domain-containing protein [Ruegeria sp. AD91A]